MVVRSAPIQTISINTNYLRIKRLFDIAFVLFIAPLVLLIGVIIALLIRLDSKGPIFFRQKRVGQNGEEFEMLKFRSMYPDSSDQRHRESIAKYMSGEKVNEGTTTALSYKLVNDDRITRVGQIIRRLSLDELPQFWNVLRGEMTLVGPRPPVPYEVEQYSSHDWLRLSGKPGLTGTWQVYGRSRVTFHEMVEMDIDYLQHPSFWVDLKLIALTIPVILLGRGGA